MISLDRFRIRADGFCDSADMNAFWPLRLILHEMHNTARDGRKVCILILHF
jgi:hypothetical protein